jgi:hypothetical protein
MALSIVRFDMRAPAFSPASASAIYATALDMAAWADEQGFAMVVLPKHHASDDGYLPAPLSMAGCVVGRTRRTPISQSATKHGRRSTRSNARPQNRRQIESSGFARLKRSYRTQAGYKISTPLAQKGYMTASVVCPGIIPMSAYTYRCAT